MNNIRKIIFISAMAVVVGFSSALAQESVSSGVRRGPRVRPGQQQTAAGAPQKIGRAHV